MISLLMPTRKRPENIKRLWDSILETVEDIAEIEIILYVDKDDDSYENLNIPLKIIKGDRIILSEMWNKCYEKSSGEILMHCGDDIIFKTKNWNKIVEDKFLEYEDRIIFVFGNDGSPHNGVFGTHGFIHKNWVEAIGYFVPPYFVSDFNDTWLNDVAKMINRHLHVDILTEHMHYSLGKANIDETTQDRINRHLLNKPQDLYYSEEMHEKRKKDADKLKEKIIY